MSMKSYPVMKAKGSVVSIMEITTGHEEIEDKAKGIDT